MKYRFLFPILLALSLTLTSCNNFNSIKKNKLMVETIEPPNKPYVKSILSEEEAKLKALEALEKYFDVTLYLTEVDCYAYFTNPSIIKSNLTRLNIDNNSIMKFENSSSLLENGTYSISFYSKNRPNSSEKYFDYFVDLDCKTGELVNFSHYSYVYPTKNKLDIEDSEKLAKEFIEKTSLGSIKNIKLTDKTAKLINENNTYKFTFEDRESPIKKVTINIDVNSKKITSFSVGIMTLLNDN